MDGGREEEREVERLDAGEEKQDEEGRTEGRKYQLTPRVTRLTTKV